MSRGAGPYVVEQRGTIPTRPTPEQRRLGQRTGSGTVLMVSYWYGPDHGWGTTTSTTLADYSVAHFATKAAAQAALRQVFTAGEQRRRGYSVVPLAWAQQDFAERAAAREAAKAAQR